MELSTICTLSRNTCNFNGVQNYELVTRLVRPCILTNSNDFRIFCGPCLVIHCRDLGPNIRAFNQIVLTKTY